MKLSIIIIFFLLNTTYVFSREIGETEIIAEEGIDVFQDEKYYLLKKNVKIESDNFILFGDIIKIFFDKDLYDIKIIDAVGNVKLVSSENNLKASGEKLFFIIAEEEILIEGLNSKLITKDTIMLSDGKINVNNLKGDFYLNGPNSRLESENIIIKGREIDGVFSTNTEVKEIIFLDVYDEKIAYVNDSETEMYANKIKYNEKTSLIELENNVKIISDGETITGDYGTLDTKTNSYKIKSKDSKRVRVIISNTDE